MYQSDYFEEQQTAKKNGMTSASLTVGIIVTFLVMVFYFINIVGAVMP